MVVQKIYWAELAAFKNMSVTALLRQITKTGLDILQKDLEIYEDIIAELAPKNTDIPLIADISELTLEQRQILDEITSDANEVCNVWTEWDVEMLVDLKRYCPKNYERWKQSLYSIVCSEKNCSYLYLGQAWDWVSYVLRNGQAMNHLDCICVANDLNRVNIFAGKPVDPTDLYPCCWYQEVSEVAEISRVLSAIGEKEIRRRFEQAAKINPPIYRGGWSEDQYPFLQEFLQEVQLFYQVTADQGLGMVSSCC